MKYYELELNGKTIKFRLKASDSVAIEEKTKTKLLDYIQDYSMATVITLLTYLRRGEDITFSQTKACELYDELVDAGYTLEKILFDVIYEALVISGFLAKEDLENMKIQKEEAKKKLETKKQEA